MEEEQQRKENAMSYECHKCREPIEMGEADRTYPLNGSGRYWHFHPGCFHEWEEEQMKQETRLRNIARLAGTVH